MQLIFAILHLQFLPRQPKIVSQDGDESNRDSRNNMCYQFQSGHFNGDSSSDEEAFTRDLEFSGVADERDSAATRGISSFITQVILAFETIEYHLLT